MKSDFVAAASEKRIKIPDRFICLFDELGAEIHSIQIEPSDTRLGRSTMNLVYTMVPKKKLATSYGQYLSLTEIAAPSFKQSLVAVGR